jgi:hypothetical protein
VEADDGDDDDRAVMAIEGINMSLANVFVFTLFI